jgi:hypothetical protein
MLEGSVYTVAERKTVDNGDSVFVGEFQRRVNLVIKQGRRRVDIDFIEIEETIIRDPDIIPEELRDAITPKLIELGDERRRSIRRAHTQIARAWQHQLGGLDQCLAFADLLSERFSSMIFNRGFDVLSSKDPRPHDEAASGATLKCLLLLSLFGRSVSIAAEIAHLIRGGFLDGAESRLRSLHEHVVIMMFVHNDKTYEASECLQDHASVEYLKELRAYKRSYTNPIYSPSPERDAAILSEVTEAEAAVRDARARWGNRVDEQYGWARCDYLGRKKNNKRIYFSDLEEAAGMSVFRGDYLRENNHVHAGPYAAISHLDLRIGAAQICPTGPGRDDLRIDFLGARCCLMLEFVSRAAGKSISWEAEEYDDFLYVCEMLRLTDSVGRSFHSHP